MRWLPERQHIAGPNIAIKKGWWHCCSLTWRWSRRRQCCDWPSASAVIDGWSRRQPREAGRLAAVDPCPPRVVAAGGGHHRSGMAELSARPEAGRPAARDRWCAIWGPSPTRGSRARRHGCALPITEHTGLPFSSHRRRRSMRAGHDAHTAMLLATGRVGRCRRPAGRGAADLPGRRGGDAGGVPDAIDAGVLAG